MKSNGNYDWKFSTLGGATRVCITSGEDIAHLDELDQKYWTVLSCPVKGLEMDEATLTLLDSDGDGKIRVGEVLAASRWLCKVLANPDLLVGCDDNLPLASLSDTDEEGKALKASARGILEKLGLNQDYITLDNLAAASKLSEEKSAETADASVFPYGEKTAEALDACMAVKAKIDDYFMRCKLAAFNADSKTVLDVSVDSIASISGRNLADCGDVIASYPIAHVNPQGILDLDSEINPAWQAAVARMRSLVLGSDKTLDEAKWNSIVSGFEAFKAWNEGKVSSSVDGAEIAALVKLTRLYRDFFTLLNNFVTFKDFYRNPQGKRAIFQAGTLYIDQRSCDLCIKVSDMGKHSASADLSGLYLLYCDCVCKINGATMTIVAAMTDGDISNLRVGKNAIFYDRNGLDWDATVVKIIDNPISLRQAFWSPYRKFGRFVSETIEKFASDKEGKVVSQGAEGISNAGANITAAPSGEAPKAAFDISKFAGIFAMIGMALGTVLGFFLDLFSKFFALKVYQMVLVILAIMLIISGPSMLKAWLKLRKRNIGALLNANGWAVNSGAVVNVKFGTTLTSIARMPFTKGVDDPLADKPMAVWKKVLIWIVGIAAVCAIVWFSLPEEKRPCIFCDTEVTVEAPAPTVEAPAPTMEVPEQL